LQSQVKQAHWNVKGPHFIALHELFDKISDAVLEQIDEIAERITSLGGTAEGTVAVAAKRSKLKNYPLSITAGKDHLFYLSTQLSVYGKAVRAAIDDTDELGDADTADLFTGFRARSTSICGFSRRICKTRPEAAPSPCNAPSHPADGRSSCCRAD
jgi:starvation-inducible DNA-binding protein